MSEETKVWGIHNLDSNLFLSQNVIAIGWEEMGDLSSIEPNRDAFKKKYSEVYSDAKKGSIATGAGMLYRFLYEAQIGDYVVYPSKFNREINIGQITSDYFYTTEKYSQRRTVKWIKHIPRTAFTQGALYEVGSAMSFFSVKNYADEFLSALDKDFKKHSSTGNDDEDDTVAATAEEILESTRDFVLKELSRHLKGYDLEEFVADLLNAMGYRTTVSKHGGDNGIDIIAYKDELPPRILVQVKSQDGDIKETTIQSLKGAMREGDYGVFVTLSDYTKNARKYLDSTPIIRGINGIRSFKNHLALKSYTVISQIMAALEAVRAVTASESSPLRQLGKSPTLEEYRSVAASRKTVCDKMERDLEAVKARIEVIRRTVKDMELLVKPPRQGRLKTTIHTVAMRHRDARLAAEKAAEEEAARKAAEEEAAAAEREAAAVAADEVARVQETALRQQSLIDEFQYATFIERMRRMENGELTTEAGRQELATVVARAQCCIDLQKWILEDLERGELRQGFLNRYDVRGITRDHSKLQIRNKPDFPVSDLKLTHWIWFCYHLLENRPPTRRGVSDYALADQMINAAVFFYLHGKGEYGPLERSRKLVRAALEHRSARREEVLRLLPFMAEDEEAGEPAEE